MRLCCLLAGMTLLGDALAQILPPDALTEGNASNWGVATDTGIIAHEDDSDRVRQGSNSIRVVTTSGDDTWAWTPVLRDAGWDLSDVVLVRFWVYAQNLNAPGFQNASPRIRLGTTETDYIELRPTHEVLNLARDNWLEVRIPVNGDDIWIRSETGSPDISNINFFEFHADTWEFGFEYSLDGLAFLSVLQGPFERDELQLYETWRYTPRLYMVTELKFTELTGGDLTDWKSSTPAVASVDANGRISALQAGSTLISAKLHGVEYSLPVEVVAPVLPPQTEQIHPELAQPAEGYVWDMPVLVIRYLPTADGVNLDTSVAPDYFELGEISLANMMEKLDIFDRRQKFMLEEGSRFRGYKRPDARPSLGYKVVKYITVFEPLPPGKFERLDANGKPVHYVDYFGMFERLGVEDIVNSMGIREIWLWNGDLPDSSQPSYDPLIHDPINFRRVWESNMSSPFTPDVSNSDQDRSDLPIYGHTFVLYGQNIRRTQAETVHNHGHQLERILPFAEFLQDGTNKLFNQDFIGFDQDFIGFDPVDHFTLGRAGWTHMTPNTVKDYSYDDPNPVESDIEDWRPDNSGARTIVNLNTWGNLVYDWPGGAAGVPQRIESQWYIYWMQNMPGLDNGIPYQQINEMTNWWYLTARWEEAIKDGYGLHTSIIHRDGFE